MNIKSLGVLTALVVVAVGAVVGIAFGMQHSSGVSSCSENVNPVVHRVIIKEDKLTPATVTAKLCEKLTVINQDYEIREVAFGPHDDHVPYDGVTEKVLRQGQSFTITLNQTGAFRVHDHIHDEVSGMFVVTR